MKGLLLIGGLLASAVSGHIQMSKPYPIRSPLNKDSSGQKDYSYTNPLSTDGSDYPCKGYAADSFESVANYSPGQQYDLELQGSAVHGGGSCQLSLSYDKGKTFRVIHSMLGGCPITKEYKFSIPSSAPSGEALFAWSWFNKVGNREMYMNCAQVTIGGSGSRLQSRESFDSLPELFQANNGGPGDCSTIEGEEVNFPAPGPSVEGSLSGKGYKCKGSAPFLTSSHSSSSGASSDSGSSSSAAYTSSSTSTSSSSSTSSSTSTPTSSSTSQASSSSTSTPSSSSAASRSSSMVPFASSSAKSSSSMAAPSSSLARSSSAATSSKFSKVASTFGTASYHILPTVGPEREPARQITTSSESCIEGSIVCAEDGSSWSLCSDGAPVHMGNVAAGTSCKHGAMHRVN